MAPFHKQEVLGTSQGRGRQHRLCWEDAGGLACKDEGLSLLWAARKTLGGQNCMGGNSPWAGSLVPSSEGKKQMLPKA